MAKFSRFDQSNKKRNKHKKHHDNKDLRIREVSRDNGKHQGRLLREVVNDDEYDWDDDPQQLNS
jgi:hypothetical protein